MKVGYRKPSVKRSVSARTTGRVKRAVKSSINPTYGKSGMGYINNPQKAVYNKVYNKTTTSVFSSSGSGSKSYTTSSSEKVQNETLIPASFGNCTSGQLKGFFILFTILSVIMFASALYIESIVSFLIAVAMFLYGLYCLHYSLVLKNINSKTTTPSQPHKTNTSTHIQTVSKPQTLANANSTLSSSIKSSVQNIENKKEEALKLHDKYIANSSNPKWHRPETESRTRADFYMNNGNEISKYEDAILSSNAVNSSFSLDSRINALKQSIKAYHDFKDYCYRSEGGKIYFQDMWEYCHNSKNDCFAFVDSLEEKLKKLQLQQQQNYLYEQTKDFLIELLRQKNELLQSELFNKYPKSKNLIKKAIEELASNDIISKTKFKNSYIIKLKIN